MFDTLPFPNMTAKDAEERSKQTIDYLLQLREELVFILDSIVSGEYGKLTAQPTQVNVTEKTIVNSSEDTLTVSEVINSATFKAAMNGIKEMVPDEYLVSATQTYVSGDPGGINLYLIKDSSGRVQTFQIKNGKSPKVTLAVNYETGNLEYTTS